MCKFDNYIVLTASLSLGVELKAIGNYRSETAAILAQTPVHFSIFSGYHAPWIVIFEAALSILRKSSDSSSTASIFLHVLTNIQKPTT
jgi:hypothetical protein